MSSPLAAANDFDEGCKALDQKEYDVAITHFDAVLRKRPTAAAFYNRGNAHLGKRDYDRAAADFGQALSLEPRMADALYGRARAWSHGGRCDLAIADYSQVIGLAPKSVLAYSGRADTYYQKRDYERAIADYTEVIRLDPRQARAFNNRGRAYCNRKEYERAAAYYAAAIRLQHDYAQALNNFAWLLATCPRDSVRDGRKAVEYATRAQQLSGGGVASCLDTLAAAHAECGDFTAAVFLQQKALQAGFEDEQEAARAVAHLRLYESGRPCRDE
jgi:tetratricopeptide (TPR) repeat protein